jgi:hypothetical protein
LPDFSWCNVPKRRENAPNANKITKWPLNIPNGHKIYQHFLFQGPSNYPQFGIFWFDNKLSGNPAPDRLSDGHRLCIHVLFNLMLLLSITLPVMAAWCY